jgi:hypothetical protein
MTKLRKGDRLVLLPSGEETTVHVVGKNSFSVRDHVTALLLADEYDPKENPAGKWCRLEEKSGQAFHRAAADAARAMGASFEKAQEAGFAATSKLAK